jgi:rhodanese-related sulfurtransferase
MTKMSDTKSQTAGKPKTQPGTQPKTDVKVIAKEELNSKIKHGDHVQIVNVLDPEHYALGVIKGSKKIPFAELETRLGELDKNVEVVTYCASVDCDKSRKAATLLAEKGFKVRAYEGGAKEWKAAGLPIE